MSSAIPPARVVHLRARDDLMRLAAGLLQLVVLLGIPVLFVYALLFASDKAVEAPAAATTILAIPSDLVRAAPGRYCEGDVADLVVVYTNDAEKGTTATTRAEKAVLQAAFEDSPSGELGVQLVRGEADGKLTPFVSALAGAQAVYVLVDNPRDGATRCG